MGACLLFLLVWGIQAQDTTSIVVHDSIQQMEYQKLYKLIYDIKRDQPELAEKYAEVYLNRAKKEKNILEQAKGYRLFVFINPKSYEQGISYIDSAITIGKNLKGKKYPALLYIHKGLFLEEQANFKKALDNHLIALNIAKKRENGVLENVCNHNIALIKRKFGHYEESKALFKNVVQYDLKRYQKKEIPIYPYHLSLKELINTYRLNQQIDSAYILNERGIKESKGEFHAPYFILNRGILSYHKDEYIAAVKDIQSILPIITNPKNGLYFNTFTMLDAYLYLGKSYDALPRKELAIHYYKKIDSIAETTNYVLPETITAYLALKKHYSSIDDKNNQLVYINKLLRADSILNDNYTYLRKTLKNEYDTPRLVAQKEALIQELEASNKTSSWWVWSLATFVLIVSGMTLFYYRKQHLYKVRFQKLIAGEAPLRQPFDKLRVTSQDDMLREPFDNARSEPFDKLRTSTAEGLRVTPEDTDEISHSVKSEPAKLNSQKGEKDLGISSDIVTKVLQELDTFEKKQEFLKTNLTTASVAQKLKTNAKYLSKIINYHKQKSFTQYINELRIDFIVEALKANTRYRQYTIKALASEAGFNSTEVFSKSFYKKTGIYPSYFIKQLEKQGYEEG
ncbi:helix-turn-helix domain-containing protein [Aquimarina sp. 2201CG1-2-11]|uniref:helix-turn-helix domain-containing protein n=1 Tax=Aquimarina discodermiae TaxID=3231043 RepID=UPI00346356CD